MVRKLLIGIGVLISCLCIAQTQQDFGRRGLLKADLVYAQSFMLHYPIANVYLCGDLEYFTSDHLSIRGDCFWYLDSRQTTKVFNQNALVLYGFFYNFPLGISNFHVGIQPGFSFTKPYDLHNADKSYAMSFQPALCLSAGYTLYFSKFCNFNFGVKYVASRYRGTPYASLNLDEFMVSGGLGFQLHTKKQGVKK